MRRCGILVPLLWAAAAGGGAAGDFAGEVRPILSEHCYGCHGPDAATREAGLRLDVPDGLFKELDGRAAVVPGRPDRSEILARLRSADPDRRMPPPGHPRRPTREQVESIARWIAQGAAWERHWSLVPPAGVTPPPAGDRSGVRNEIDEFVLARLAAEGIEAGPPADRATLLRRVTLDLTGLPPTPTGLDAFLADPSPDAYERAVDRLLASPRFGERMAADWLDLARYADTNGYFRDNARSIWPWRDWVIAAFNANKPFDAFTVEQLAGDLLPDPTTDQLVATGFNRNHMVTGETGVDDEEYRVEYVADRVETTATAWLGLTVGCARCHDHKYDPISQREYYGLFAFFNNGPETGLVGADDPPPTLEVATAEQRAEADRRRATRAAAEAAFDRFAEPLKAEIAAWERAAPATFGPPTDGLATYVAFEPELDASAGVVARGGGASYEPGVLGRSAALDATRHFEVPTDVEFGADEPWSVGFWIKPAGSLHGVLSKLGPGDDGRGFEVLWRKGRLQVNLVHRPVAGAIEAATTAPVSKSEWHHVVVGYDGSRRAAGLKVFVDGRKASLEVLRDTLDGPTGNAGPLRIGRRDDGPGYAGRFDELRVLRRTVDADEAAAWHRSDRLRGILALTPEKRDAKQKAWLLDDYVRREAGPAVRDSYLAAVATRLAEESFAASLPETLVMRDLPQPRTTRLLIRGRYDQPGEEVPPGVPAGLPPLTADARPDRHGLARWLTSPGHPLTARVQVNRLWRQCFGEGLVRTADDFGSQGEPPTHPELLDRLAADFVTGGWDVKATLRRIVTSETYRRDSAAAPEAYPRDPENRLLARGPRFRLTGEMIRDQALAASGLLSGRLGGPSVKPYQPPGLWEAVSYDGELSYEPDRGDGLRRRSLYTFWKRQSPPPALLIFDAPTRETCAASRPRTNTPAQALVLLNDETYVEAARVLAASVLAETDDDAGRLRRAFRRVTSREPDGDEAAVLLGLLDKQRTRFAADPSAAAALTRVGVSTAGRELDPVELAPWTVVTQAILNLDEIVTRR